MCLWQERQESDKHPAQIPHAVSNGWENCLEWYNPEEI